MEGRDGEEKERGKREAEGKKGGLCSCEFSYRDPEDWLIN